jgi:hypothetical protein
VFDKLDRCFLTPDPVLLTLKRQLIPQAGQLELELPAPRVNHARAPMKSKRFVV